MNENIKRLVQECNDKVNRLQPKATPTEWLDAFIIEYTRGLIFESTDVIREKAKESANEGTRNALKVVAIDVLDHFGL